MIHTESVAHLPAFVIADEVNRRLEQSNRLVITAPPGAGKSTLLPLTMLESVEGRILMLEPRRLAARSVAERMAQLLGENVGETVGYRVRFESCISARTRIEVLTEGILTRMLVDDPMLDGVSVVIFDEFHERSLTTDLALALTRESQDVIRPDLRIVLMSATIDVQTVCQQFATQAGNRSEGERPEPVALVQCEGRMYPVTVVHQPREDESVQPESVARDMARTILKAHREEEGDILAFLPGQAEIARCQQLLDGGLADTQVYPLYGMLTSEEQWRAVRPSPSGQRKVVLATNIAETSLTIEGIRIVVDSGLQRKMVFDQRTELSHLQTVAISLDMARQRTGRAGRLAAGTCYRLWARHDEHRMAECRQPELLDADLSSLVLDVAAFGEADPSRLPWITPPPAARLQQASKLLQILGATDKQGRITPMGRRMASMACHPRIARMLLTAETDEEKCLAADVAALLEERDPLLAAHVGTGSASVDVNVRIAYLREKRRTQRERNATRLFRVSEEYHRWLRVRPSAAALDPELTGRLLAMAYPERIARQLDAVGNFRMANGSNVRLDVSDELAAREWIVVVQLNASTGRVFMASPVSFVHLRSLAQCVDRLAWNNKSGTLLCQQELRLGQLVLETHPLQASREQQVEALCQAAQSYGESMFDFGKSVQQLQLRVAQVAQWHPDLLLPDLSTPSVLSRSREWLPFYLDNNGRLRTDVSELRKLPLAEALWTLLSYEQQQAVERLAPAHIVVPTGSRIHLDYRQGAEAPVLSVRLQECFGLTDTPCVDDGRQPVLMELLSPGFKPVQLTQDLRSFWANTYFEVRKELRRRYPKHAWPENPLEAAPTRGVRNKSGIR